MKFGICNEMFKDSEWKEIVDYVAKVGYEGIEIAPFTFTEDVKEISAMT